MNSQPNSQGSDLRQRLSDGWEEVKAKVRARFDQLTDEDVSAVGGRYDDLSQRLQRAYGYDQTRANQEIDTFVSGFSTHQRGQSDEQVLQSEPLVQKDVQSPNNAPFPTESKSAQNYGENQPVDVQRETNNRQNQTYRGGR